MRPLSRARWSWSSQVGTWPSLPKPGKSYNVGDLQQSRHDYLFVAFASLANLLSRQAPYAPGRSGQALRQCRLCPTHTSNTLTLPPPTPTAPIALLLSRHARQTTTFVLPVWPRPASLSPCTSPAGAARRCSQHRRSTHSQPPQYVPV